MDERRLLGRGVLAKLAELRQPGKWGMFRLYMGDVDAPIVIHRSKFTNAKGEERSEPYVVDSEGVLRRGLWAPNLEPFEGEGTGLPLLLEGDFEKLEYESVASLHRAVMEEGFWEDSAYRLSRKGKPGYRDVWAFDPAKERSERWRLMG